MSLEYFEADIYWFEIGRVEIQLLTKKLIKFPETGSLTCFLVCDHAPNINFIHSP